jgi:hypothetical protein
MCEILQPYSLLSPSKSFNVSAWAIGAPGTIENMNRLPVATVEDYFTFFHQSLLNTISQLTNKKTSLSHMRCPTWIKKLSKEIIGSVANMPGEELKTIFLVGIKMTEGKAIFNYNYPLNNHSATLTLEYNRKNNLASLQCNIFGGYGLIARDRFQPIEKRIKQYVVSSSSAWNNVTFTFNLTEETYNRDHRYIYSVIFWAALMTLYSFDYGIVINIKNRVTEEFNEYDRINKQA